MSSTDQTKGLVRKLASQLGIEIALPASKGSGRARLSRFLLSRQVNLVLDVGANVGQYATELRAVGYGGRIVSFEPVADVHRRLRRIAARDPHWVIAPRAAIGSEEGVISINVSASSFCSSALKSANWLARMDATTAGAHAEQVPLVTLNSLAPQFLGRGDVAFLKVDVQGFEYEVLHGADKILPGLCGVQLELSLLPLYQGEKPFRFMLDFMESKGFELHSLASVFAGETTGREIQMDAIFVRAGGAARLTH